MTTHVIEENYSQSNTYERIKSPGTVKYMVMLVLCGVASIGLMSLLGKAFIIASAISSVALFAFCMAAKSA